MARSLIQQGRAQLQKAQDAYTDPADLTPPAPVSVSRTAIGNTHIQADQKEGDKDISTAGIFAGTKASIIDGETTATAQVRRPPRRRGRPRGPDRVALSVRIRAELDARLTAAVDTTGLGPQEIVEAALATWLDRLDRQRRH